MKPTIERTVIEEIYRHLTTTAKNMLVDQGHVRPQLFLYKADGTVLMAAPAYIMDLFFNSGESKELMRKVIGKLLAGDAPGIEADIIAVITEAWVASGSWLDEEQTLAALLDGTLQVRDLDKKGEAIVVTIYTLDGTNMGLCPIITAADGKRSGTLKPMFPENETGLAGRMVIKPTKFEVPR